MSQGQQDSIFSPHTLFSNPGPGFGDGIHLCTILHASCSSLFDSIKQVTANANTFYCYRSTSGSQGLSVADASSFFFFRNGGSLIYKLRFGRAKEG